MAFHHIIQLNKLHTETDIRFVASIQTHSIMPGHTGKIAKFQAFNLFKEMFGQTFEHVQHIILLNKRHLTVNLRKLRLTVCS